MATATSKENEMKVKPLGDKLLVRRAEAQSQTDAGIYLPESAKDKPAEGEIIATGSGILNKETGDRLPFTVKTGDRVIFTSYAGTEVKLDGDTLLIMTEDDILGILN
jgi:chaperonin GroES